MKLLAFFLILTSSAISQVVTEIGNVSEGSSSVVLSLSHRFQKYKSSGLHKNDHYDRSINSPKSVKIIDAKKKFYIHSLEGYTTSVYSLENFKLLKTIEHKFHETNKALFQDTFYFKQNFRTKSSDWNTFKGKPVESCLSHNGKYLWVTYYRRSYDANAIDPSAVCIIDTDSDSIVRVIPTGPLPKMITCSPDNKHIAISHWGNNTVALIDIQGNNPKQFHYVTELLVDKKMSLDYRFRNGELIPEAKTKNEWETASEEGRPAFCYYNNDPTTAKKYGVLYNWYAVNDPRGLAPEGWRVPSYSDIDKINEFEFPNLNSDIKYLKDKQSQGISPDINKYVDKYTLNDAQRSKYKFFRDCDNPMAYRPTWGDFEIEHGIYPSGFWTISYYKDSDEGLKTLVHCYGTRILQYDLSTDFVLQKEGKDKGTGLPVRLIKAN